MISHGISIIATLFLLTLPFFIPCDTIAQHIGQAEKQFGLSVSSFLNFCNLVKICELEF